MKYTSERKQLIDYARRLNSSGLSIGKSGNLSLRCEEGLLITPTGMAYDKLQTDDIVLLNLEGRSLIDDQLQASSEWHFHCGIYQQRRGAQAVVHAHSTYCTALACSHQPIPAFHYMVAVAGGSDIPLAPYALYGTEALSENVTAALEHRDACLLANHGMIALGKSLPEAFNLATEVESLAQQYSECLKLGTVRLLSEQQMAEVLEKFDHYGQRL